MNILCRVSNPVSSIILVMAAMPSVCGMLVYRDLTSMVTNRSVFFLGFPDVSVCSENEWYLLYNLGFLVQIFLGMCLYKLRSSL